MDTITALRLANLALSLGALPSSWYMFSSIFKERKLVKTNLRGLNALIGAIFFFVVVSALLNAGYLIWILSNNTITSEAQNIRMLFTTGLYFVGSWGFVIYRNGSKK